MLHEESWLLLSMFSLSQVTKPKKAGTESNFELVCLGSPPQACVANSTLVPVHNSPASDPVPSSLPLPLPCDPVSASLFRAIIC